MSPEAAYVLEKPQLLALPAYLPPVYRAFARTVDVEGYAYLDTNRHSVPERLIGKQSRSTNTCTRSRSCSATGWWPSTPGWWASAMGSTP